MHQLLVLALVVGGSAGAAGCGGHLQGPHGVIQTPNFPDAFPVPIRCKWVISHATPNGTISIYFTQQYTTTGLTFTEYMYYDDSYKLGERKAFTVTEENITKVKRIQFAGGSARDGYYASTVKGYFGNVINLSDGSK
ncbi:unnamed protein product [Plutella xylostella]|uniref:(diamondback moth) hypothetical protein n=1 Tax=Plutella xylostella TaxID=51655 RepID=A0A8S4G689_PLUXY|nr:unnamed protein product [Plutella xylostella]